MLKQESVLANEVYKILWDFKIHTDHQIPAWGSEFVLIDEKKSIWWISVVPADCRVKREFKIDKWLNSLRERKELWNMKQMRTPIQSGAFGMVSKNIGKRVGKLLSRGSIQIVHMTSWHLFSWGLKLGHVFCLVWLLFASSLGYYVIY